MSSPRNKRIMELAEAALARGPDERAAFLDDACGSDVELRSTVEEYLQGSSSTTQSLSDSALLATNAPTQPLPTEPPSRLPVAMRINSYEILGVLGEGSMGVVYRARQNKPQRVVALKVVKAGGASETALRRFEHETQMLGRLQHPGIAQIFEAGTADTGYGTQPFFAMELIQGMPLNEYATQRSLKTRSRLKLLIKIAEGVEHAHQKGVIHRDLKPSNIIVDTSGQPKILDFGIALAANPDHSAASTDLWQPLAGTIPYMSYEQIKGDPNEIDTRTDVYSLGVIAYQLLVHQLPFDLSGMTMGQARELIASQTPAPLGSVDKQHKGDLEIIIAKALQREKLDRYQSSSDFAADIGRFLKSEPILAREATSRYLLQRFAKRNKALVGGLLGVFLMLIVAVIGTSVGLNQARQEKARTDVVKDLFFDVFKAADREKFGRNVTLRDALTFAEANLDEASLDNAPDVKAAVHEAFGQSYMDLGELERAQEHLEKACKDYQRELGETNRLTLSCLGDLAMVHKNANRFDQAQELYRQVIDKQKRILGVEDPETLETRHNLAGLLRAVGENEEAERLYRVVLDAQTRVLGPYDRNTLITANSLAWALKDRGQFDEAETLYRNALAIQKENLGDNHTDTLTTAGNLAALLKEQNRLDEAEDMYTDTLRRREEHHGKEHPDTMLSLSKLAGIVKARGRYADAEKHYRQVVTRQRRVLGDEHANTITSMNNLAITLRLQGTPDDLKEAEEIYGNIIRVQQRTHGPQDRKTLIASNNLASVLMERGALQEAEKLYRMTMATLHEEFGAKHPRSINTAYNLANVLVKQEKFRDAVPLLREVLEGWRALYEPKHPNIARGLYKLSEALVGLKKWNDAEPLLRECLAIRREILTEGDWRIANAQSLLGESLTNSGQYEEAETLLLRNFEPIKKKWGENNDRTRKAAVRICQLYDLTKRPQRADPYRKTARP